MKDELQDYPFWRRLAGYWRGSATYCNGSLEALIRDYDNLLAVSLNGREMIQVEHRFYPPGDLVNSIAQHNLPYNEGVETVHCMRGRLVDAEGTVDFGQMVPPLKVYDEHCGLRTARAPDTGNLQHRTWLMFTTDDHLITTVNGIFWTSFKADWSNQPQRDPQSGLTGPNDRLGQLKSHSVFRQARMPRPDWPAAQDALRAKNRVSHALLFTEKAPPALMRTDELASHIPLGFNVEAFP